MDPTKADVMQKGITREQVERVARIYKTNQDAGQALGITMRSFGRLCRKYGVETPYGRRRRRLHEEVGHTDIFPRR